MEIKTHYKVVGTYRLSFGNKINNNMYDIEILMVCLAT